MTGNTRLYSFEAFAKTGTITADALRAAFHTSQVSLCDGGELDDGETVYTGSASSVSARALADGRAYLASVAEVFHMVCVDLDTAPLGGSIYYVEGADFDVVEYRPLQVSPPAPEDPLVTMHVRGAPMAPPRGQA